MKLVDMAKRLVGIDVAKRAGLYVSRPVVNAAEWHAWATAAGVPNVVPAEEMHVTVLYSTVNVMAPQDDCVLVQPTRGYAGGIFAFFGPDEEALVFAFENWTLSDRNWFFLRNGAVSAWPTYRPHLTLSKDAPAFELPDEAMASAPEFILLGPEVYDGLKGLDASDDSEGDDDIEESTLIVISIEASKQARAALQDVEILKTLNPIDRTALRDIASERPIAKGVARRLADQTWCPAEVAKAFPKAPPVAKTVKRTVERDVRIIMKATAIPEEIMKKFNLQKVDLQDEGRHIVKGIASVSTVDGVEIEDWYGDTVTTQFLEDFNRSLIGGTRAGKFEHKGDARAEIVGGLVLGNDWQRALGIDLGFEPYLIDMHVPGDEDWAEVKKGGWMFSIAGRVLVEDEEAVA